VRLVLALIALSTVCQARSMPVDISGVWVLDTNADGINGVQAGRRLAMSVEVEAGEVSVTLVWADSHWQHVVRRRYLVTLRLPVSQRRIERLILRNQITGASEEWSLTDGKLTIASRTGSREEQLVFHPAERLECPAPR
jgi:hypothetical protein